MLVQEEMNSIVLTSKIIHEMFHGFQMMHNDSRFFDELDALYNYKYEEDNLNLKLKENHLLYHMSTQFDEELFGEFLQIRKYRFNTFRYAYHYESSIEQIEGTANFVELQCLKQLSAELFEKALSAMRERVINPSNLLPIRVICYDIGALMLYVMSENNIAFEDGFSSLTFAEAIINDVEGKKYVPEYSMKDLLDSYNAKARAIICKAIEKNILDGRVDYTPFLPRGKPDAVVLGCTHYVYIGEQIGRFYSCTVFDGNHGIALRLRQVLEDEKTQKTPLNPFRPPNAKNSHFSPSNRPCEGGSRGEQEVRNKRKEKAKWSNILKKEGEQGRIYFLGSQKKRNKTISKQTFV